MDYVAIAVAAIVLAAAGVVAGVMASRRRSRAILEGERRPRAEGKADSRMSFYLKGNQLGFKLAELRALAGLARRFGISDPSNMLLSGQTFDRCLRQILVKGSRDKLLDDPRTVVLLHRALEYRMGVERNRPRNRTGMETTRTLESGQILKLLLPGIGLFPSRVAENFRTHIVVDMPLGKGVPINHRWRDQRVDVYFWRRGDAMYYFDTVVLNSPDKAALAPKLHLRHAEQLMRTQKRASIRVVVMKEGRIMPLSEAIPADERWLEDSGYLCKVTDISETGAAVLVRGKVRPGRSVKLQIELGGLPIVLCGAVRSATLNVTHNVSLLHVEASPPLSMAMRIKVMAYVLGLVTDDAPAEAPSEPENPQDEADGISAADAPSGGDEAGQDLSGDPAADPPRPGPGPAQPAGGGGPNIFDDKIP